MSSSLRHIPVRTLGSSAAHLRYLDEDPELEPFLGMRPRDVSSLLRRAPLNARRAVDPQLIARSLLEYAQAHDAPQQVLDNARAVGDGELFMVVTGQQPGLFGGPLYTVHKAATAVRLCREINAQPDGPRAVPLFWNHTDDHDLDEVNRAFFLNSNNEIQRIRLDLERSGEPIHSIGVGHSMEHALGAVGDLLPHSDFRDWALGMFEPRHPDEHFGAALTRMLFSMFGEDGLLVIEPRRLPSEAFEVLPRWWEQAGSIQDQAKSTIEVLNDLGFDLSMDPGTTLMFQDSGGRRVALAEGDPISQTGDLSPGVLLRPLWQDAVLPTIAAVVGPGELSYLAVAGPLYRKLGVPCPVYVPRASLTLLEPSLSKLLKRFGWDLTDLDVDTQDLIKAAVGEHEDGDDDELEGLVQHVEKELHELATTMRKVDPQMVRAVDRSRSKVLDELNKLHNKLRNSRANRQGTGERQVRRLHNTLKPRGRPQERVLTVLPYLLRHGPELSEKLIQAADPFTLGHGVLEL